MKMRKRKLLVNTFCALAVGVEEGDYLCGGCGEAQEPGTDEAFPLFCPHHAHLLQFNDILLQRRLQVVCTKQEQGPHELQVVVEGQDKQTPGGHQHLLVDPCLRPALWSSFPRLC